MHLETLECLFQEQLHDIYYAEQKLDKALEDMAKEATNPALASAFTSHRTETQGQAQKLESVMESLGYKVKGEKCDAIEGLIKEAKHLIKHAKEDEVRDAALIVAAQKVEHYEIATYGSLCALAKRLGYTEQEATLRSILEQEKAADKKLSELAEGAASINERAKAA